MTGKNSNDQPIDSVGQSFVRVGAWERLLGKAHYCADITLDGMAFVIAVRSKKHHALIKSVDAQKALDCPGCLGVFTSKDIPGKNRFGIINKDQQLLAEDKVRCIGDPIAIVVGETLEVAQKAARLVSVSYQELPGIFDPEDALRPDAPRIHEKGNLLGSRIIKKGNPEEAFRTSDVVIERYYETSHVEHAYIEPDAGVALIDDSGVLTIFASTQNPHYDLKDVCDLLNLDESRVRIIQSPTGGGFGSKLDLNTQGFLGLAAWLLNRPVKMVYSREEAFLSTSKRHPLKIWYKSGASRDGRLLAAKVKIIGDTGAYASYGMAVVSRAAVHATGPYEIPNLSIESTFAYTNNPMAGAMRGFGVPQIAFAHESQMDLLAEALGLSPLEIRLRNSLRVGSQTSTGQQLEASVGISKTLEAVKPYYEKAAKNVPVLKPHLKYGVGTASMLYGIGNTGVQNPSTAQVELNKDGSITLFSGAADIGQGSSTVLSQIAAQELNIDPMSIKLVIADTGQTTSAGATSASRQTYISGNAVLDATSKLKEVLLTHAANKLKTSRSGLKMQSGEIRDLQDPSKSVTFQELASIISRAGTPLKWQGFFDPDTTPLDPVTGMGKPYAAFAYASHVAEIVVDTLTGEVQVLRVTAAHDVGKAINPENVRGQIYGGVVMGLGFALMEEFNPGKTESLKDYHIPTCADVPEIIPIIVEDYEPTGPFGAKGVGEPALIPTAPAILNAISNALGSRIYKLPANLERVLAASIISTDS